MLLQDGQAAMTPPCPAIVTGWPAISRCSVAIGGYSLPGGDCETIAEPGAHDGSGICIHVQFEPCGAA